MAQDGKKKKQFFKEFRAELKKVIWPTPKQLVNGTIAVIIIVLIAALIVLALDSTFRAFNKYGVDNIKETIMNRQNDVNNEAPSNGDKTNEENTGNETPAGEGDVDSGSDE
jgi:preprotein translocase subunit SecE